MKRSIVLFCLALLLLVSAAWGQDFQQTCDKPAFPSPTATPIDSSCGPEGNGKNETNQNTAKNNFCANGPGSPITFAKLNHLQNQVVNTKSINFGDKNTGTREVGPTVHREKLQGMGEGDLVVLKGFVLVARQEGAESVNCKNKAGATDDQVNHDIHISIVETGNEKDECKSVVAEMIPHHRPADWTADNVNKLAPRKHMVRITGQQLFDSSHVTCEQDAKARNNPKRSSLWEVHPIYKFEVCTADCDGEAQWQDLSDWLKTH